MQVAIDAKAIAAKEQQELMAERQRGTAYESKTPDVTRDFVVSGLPFLFAPCSFVGYFAYGFTVYVRVPWCLLTHDSCFMRGSHRSARRSTNRQGPTETNLNFCRKVFMFT